MYLAYSILLTLGFALMLPLFLLRREKYAGGFVQRLGSYPPFQQDAREVIWLHCVSVGETNAARPLVEALRKEFPERRLVISTTTRTGQELAHKIFGDKADAIVYFPFDWKFSVRRALEKYKPSLVLLMETEIWPRFIHEAKLSGAKIAIVNGRLSSKSFGRYALLRALMRSVLNTVDLALMQSDADGKRIIDLGVDKKKVYVTGNMKFESVAAENETKLTQEFRSRFAFDEERPLIIAASTHDPEERYVLEALEDYLGPSCRLMIVPRHPERFDAVEKLLRKSGYTYVRRSAQPSDADLTADVILLDTIGELRAAYPIAEIVFVGGSLIPHGGQSIIEPAAEGKAIVTGPHTHNFENVVREFREKDALIQIDDQVELRKAFFTLLFTKEVRVGLGNNALAATGTDAHAAESTVKYLGTVVAAPPR